MIYMGETANPGKPIDLGYERTRMAADRTLMSWFRTSLSLISFGFTIFKFFQYLVESDLITGNIQNHAPRNFGVALVGLGMILQAMAIVEYFLFQQKLSRESGQKFPVSTALVASILLSLLGILVLLNLLFRLGPI